MMLFRNLDTRSRRVIGYATLTYIFTVALLLVFAHSALSATEGPGHPLPATEITAIWYLLDGFLVLMLAAFTLLEYKRRTLVKVL